jgi:hypothetical protein
VRVFVDIVTVFAISHHDEPKTPKVDAIKNNRLISIFLFHFCIFFSEE